MKVAPAEYPPPINPVEEFIAPITDPEEERIEVGIAIVGGGPAGLACAIRAAQLLEQEPELAEKLGEVPIAVVEKGKACGAHLLSGANLRPSAMRELFPDLDPSEWPVYQEVEKDAVYLLTKRAALPLKPMPPNFRNHGNYVTSVAKLGRFLAEKAEEAGVYILTETAPTSFWSRTGSSRAPLGDKGRARAARSSAISSPARTWWRRGRSGRGHPRPLHRRGPRLLRPARPRSPALGARREGGLGGQGASRPRHPHDGLAAAEARQVERVRRQLHLSDGRGQGQHRPRRRPRLHGRHLLLSRRAAGAEDPPVHQEDP